MSDEAARWVTCSRQVNDAVGRARHLLLPGAVTTFCGSTGLGEGVWRRNATKPKCEQCLAKERERA